MPVVFLFVDPLVYFFNSISYLFYFSSVTPIVWPAHVAIFMRSIVWLLNISAIVNRRTEKDEQGLPKN